MTFKDISVRILKGNRSRYVSYFICNTFTIMTLFMYSTLLFNSGFKHSDDLVEGLGNAVIIPSVALIAFSVFFISYAHSTFVKARRGEFGLFMSLGMTLGNIRSIILYENFIVGMLSIVVGILTGSLFSRLFFLLILRIVGAAGIPFRLSLMNFGFSIGIFIAVDLFAILLTLLTAGSFEISDMLKGSRVTEQHETKNPLLTVSGIVLLIGSLTYLYQKFNTQPEKDGQLLLVCTILCIAGLYLTLHQLGNLVLVLTKRHPKLYYRNVLLISGIGYKFKQIRKTAMVIVVLVMVTIFYSGHCLNLVLTAESNAEQSNPFDLTFVQTAAKNNISQQALYKIINTKINPITLQKTMKFLEVHNPENELDRTLVISIEQVKGLGLTIPSIEPGCFYRVIPDALTNREERQRYIQYTFRGDGISFQDSYGTMVLKLKGNASLRLVDSLGFFFGKTILVDDADYSRIKNASSSLEEDRLVMINFKAWKRSMGVVNTLNKALAVYNSTTPRKEMYTPEDYFFQTASKVAALNKDKQGGALLFFLCTYIGVFFFMASCIALFLKLLSDLDQDKAKYRKLFRLGITEKEIRRCLQKEWKLLFFTAPAMGITVAFVYTSVFYKGSSLLLSAYRSDLIIGGVFLAFQTFYYLLCSRRYGDEMIDCLE